MSVDSKKIRICALVLDPYDTSPGQRFRIEQWEPYLNEKGIEIDYFPFTDENLRKILYQPGQFGGKIFGMLKAFARRIRDVFRAGEYDAVFLYRAASMFGPALLERYLKIRGIPVIYDFDDSIYLVNTSDANKKFGWLKFVGKTADICAMSSAVTVGNSHLADFASKHSENVFIVPTSIDTEIYPEVEKKPRADGKTVIGWTGSSTSQYHLEAFEPVLQSLVDRRGGDIIIKVISNREPVGFKIPYVWSAWSPETEVAEIAEIDIGIMPTPDDEWARGKCALKALQYMSLGIPAICTDMGANRDVIEQGVNGYLAMSPESWIEAFEKLIDDRELRLEMGRAARKTVVERYSMRKCAELFEEVVRKVV
ncbi:MAG: glycosyltransferase family 4 protein [Pyrinomonadaceae bacterium]